MEHTTATREKNRKKQVLVLLILLVLLSVAGVCAGIIVRSHLADRKTETIKAPVKEEKKDKILDYDNHVVRKKHTVDKVLLENDFTKSLDPAVTEKYHKSSFFGSKAALEKDWVHITSDNHLFVFGCHTWGEYGGIKFGTGKTYTMSFDLKKGSKNSNNTFMLTLAEELEGEDPRFGTQIKQVVLDFDDIENMVSFNSDKGTFASVKYEGETGICHMEIRFTVDRGANNYLINSHDSTSLNDWLLDNLYIAEITEEDSTFEWLVEDTKETFSCNINPRKSKDYVRNVLLDEKFDTSASIVLENGGRNAFFGPSKMVWDNKAARLTTGQHLFTFGRFQAWGNNFGGVEFEKNHQYVMAFDLKLGDARTQKEFHLYVMQEDDPDPRFGSVLSTLELDFADLYQPKQSGQADYFVKENTKNFASVSYDSKTRTAHIEIRFVRTVTPDIQVVSKGSGDNEWLIDNIYIADITPPVNVTKYDYANGILFDNYKSNKVVFFNDFSESADKGVTKSWQKSAFFESKAVLENGAARITSKEHVFTYGAHTWGHYGGVALAKGATYKMSFDLQLGHNDANRIFDLYVMSENGDPRFGNVEKTLRLDYMNYQKLVVTNTDHFASVAYSSKTDWAHIEIVFKTNANQNTNIVARSRGNNNWLIDNVRFEEVSFICPGHIDYDNNGICDNCGRVIIKEKDYDNQVTLKEYEAVKTAYENDYSSDVNAGVTQPWHKSPYHGSTAVLKDGQAHITSDEHVFVYGGHTYGNYGGMSFEQDKWYTASFDLKLNSDDAVRKFNLYVMTENGDPRFGEIQKTLTLNFADFDNFVTVNTDDFAQVIYDAATHTAHIKVLFQTNADGKMQLVSRQVGLNDWLIDNMLIQQVKLICKTHLDENKDGICDNCGSELIVESDYDNKVSLDEYVVTVQKFKNDFSADVNAGVTQPWHKSPYYESAATLLDGWAKIESNQHVFVYGSHSWGVYGGLTMTKDQLYKVSFDLKLGSDNANKVFNFYVMTENGDPRFGEIQKTLTLNFANFENFVTVNTDNFAHVTYAKSNRTAHIEMVFRTNAEKNTLIVSRMENADEVKQNCWLIDNFIVDEVKSLKDYNNGIDFSDYTVKSIKYENDFSEDANKGVTQGWHKSPYFGSEVSLENGWGRITSSEHLFVYGGHNYGNYGGFGLAKGTTYKTSFDLKLGEADANKIFNLYVMTENGDPRFGDVLRTLTINMADLQHLVTENTDDFASVRYDSQTEIVHIELLYQTDGIKNTDVVSRCTGVNNWLIDNMKFEEVTKPEQKS